MATLSKDSFEQNKPKIVDFINAKLLEHTGEQDAMLLDYITIMLSNGKSSKEVGDDLEALIGDTNSKLIADSLSEFVTSLNGAAVTATVPVKKIVSLKSGGGGSMMAALKTGREYNASLNAKNKGQNEVNQSSSSKRGREEGTNSGIHSNNNNSVGNVHSKIQASADGFVTNKRNRSVEGTHPSNPHLYPAKSQPAASASPADQMAKLSGFADAQEMILFQQQHLMNLLAQQQGQAAAPASYPPPAPHGYGGGRGRGTYRGGGGGRMAWNRHTATEGSTVPGAAAVPPTVANTNPAVDITTITSSSTGTASTGSGSVPGRGWDGDGRGRGRGRGRGFVPGGGRGFVAGRGRGFYPTAAAADPMNSALASVAPGFSAHKKWVRTDTPETGAAVAGGVSS